MSKEVNDSSFHCSVLPDEVIQYLQIKPDGTYCDCTAGFGGHSKRILQHLSPKGKIICFDQDAFANQYLINKFHNDPRVQIIKDNFYNLDQHLDHPIDGFLFDLGVSSYMFDQPQRGFSYRFDGPLDMRMDQENNQLTAAKILQNYSLEQLTKMFIEYGEAKEARKVARAIVQYRTTQPITSTFQLVDIIAKTLNNNVHLLKKHQAKQYFQALRIEVNQELTILQRSLQKAANLLNSSGTIVVITFHSLEDRIVKQFFHQLTAQHDKYDARVPLFEVCQTDYWLLTKKPVLASCQEIERNHRSHSAKLRAITYRPK